MSIESLFHIAQDIYTRYGADVAAEINKLEPIKVSIHAWQRDDGTGFENTNHVLIDGGQVADSDPGRARMKESVGSGLITAGQCVVSAQSSVGYSTPRQSAISGLRTRQKNAPADRFTPRLQLRDSLIDF